MKRGISREVGLIVQLLAVLLYEFIVHVFSGYLSCGLKIYILYPICIDIMQYSGHKVDTIRLHTLRLVGLVRMCAPAQMVEPREANLNYGEARARHNPLYYMLVA